MKRNAVLGVVIVVCFLAITLLSRPLSQAQSESETPPPSSDLTATARAPAPSPTPSAEVQKAVSYIAEREGIPVEALLVVNVYEAEYPMLGRRFQFVSVMDTSRVEQNIYDVLVDLDTGAIEDDPEVVEAAEESASVEKYGKLHPLLYERLQEVDDQTLLRVTFWVAADPDGRTREEIFAILAAKFPEVDEAMSRWGRPWAVDDYKLRDQIRAEYWRLKSEDIAARILPLVTELRGRGVDVHTYDNLPSVSATLSKADIELLAQREDVSAIYLTDTTAESTD